MFFETQCRCTEVFINDNLLQVYPTMATACAVRVALFSLRFIIPLVIFVLCYWKIISSLRRRAKIAASQRQHQQPAAGPSTSTAALSGKSKAPGKTQKNVIKTMIIVISCFAVCWLPFQFTYVAWFCGVRSFSFKSLLYAFGAIAFINPCANPFIYATGMYPFFRAKCVSGFRRLVREENRSQMALRPQTLGKQPE